MISPDRHPFVEEDFFGLGKIELHILPEKNFQFKKEKGQNSCFKSIEENHYNVYFSKAQEAKDTTSAIYKDWENSSVNIDNRQIDDYLISNHQRPDWQTLLKLPDRENWNKRLKQALVRQFERSYGTINKENLEKAYSSNPEELVASLSNLKNLNAVTDNKMIKAINSVLPSFYP